MRQYKYNPSPAVMNLVNSTGQNAAVCNIMRIMKSWIDITVPRPRRWRTGTCDIAAQKNKPVKLVQGITFRLFRNVVYLLCWLPGLLFLYWINSPDKNR